MDKLVKFAKKSRADVWDAFGNAISIPGYKYYTPPEQLKYRYPAPGSCPLDITDHPNLYKNDWKTPFRHSDYNVKRIEVVEDDFHPETADNWNNVEPTYNLDNPRNAKYDQVLLNESLPEKRHALLYENLDIESDEMRAEMWKTFEEQ